jgi:hypothetical protein
MVPCGPLASKEALIISLLGPMAPTRHRRDSSGGWDGVDRCAQAARRSKADDPRHKQKVIYSLVEPSSTLPAVAYRWASGIYSNAQSSTVL